MELLKRLEQRDVDMRVTFVADHRQHDLSSWSYLKYELMTETHFVWQRPNDLNHPRAYFEISLDNESFLMNPINTTSECVPKDIKGSGAYTEPGQPAALWQAGSYGSALSTLRTKLFGGYGRTFRDESSSTSSFSCSVSDGDSCQQDDTTRLDRKPARP